MPNHCWRVGGEGLDSSSKGRPPIRAKLHSHGEVWNHWVLYMDSWVFFINCKLKEFMKHIGFGIDWLIWEPFSDWFLLVSFVVYALPLLWRNRLSRLVSQIVAATSNDIWDPQTLTGFCFQQGKARWNQNVYWTIEKWAMW